MTSESDGPDHIGGDASASPASNDQPPPSAEDLAISKAKREAARERIRDIRRKGQERIDQMYADHLADHGEETETSAGDFLREVDGVDHGEADKD